MIKSSQKTWVVYVRYIFIPEQCVIVKILQTYVPPNVFAEHMNKFNMQRFVSSIGNIEKAM